MRTTVSLLIAFAVLLSLAAEPASAGWKEKREAREKAREEITESKSLCYIFRCWPWWDVCGREKDSDCDGVLDDMDQCPGTPMGAKVDEKGCPMDSDGDGVFDGLDKCPGSPEGARVDEQGCSLDSDRDGVPDGIDRCPDTPRKAEVDRAGCPVDSDGDGVFDGLDKCPNTPAGEKVDEDGCTVEVKEFIDTGMLTSTKILFETDKAELKDESETELDKIGKILAQVPDMKIEIAGHTDATGAADYNETLSNERAAAVMKYLLDKFPKLKRENFTSKGYGESKPVASNDTAEGRTKNRRVEFIIKE